MSSEEDSVVYLIKLKTAVILNFFVLLSGIVLSPALQANPTSPVELNSELNVPVCYMETYDGRRLDLRNLCASESEEAASTCNSTTAELPIRNVRYDGNSVSGQVMNQTCKTVALVKVNYEVLDQQDNPIDNGFFYTEPSTIPRGNTASFGGAIVPGSKVNITHVEWSDG